jgi:hypothetical protein
MENRFKNHDQEKVTGHDKQTVILDESQIQLIIMEFRFARHTTILESERKNV